MSTRTPLTSLPMRTANIRTNAPRNPQPVVVQHPSGSTYDGDDPLERGISNVERERRLRTRLNGAGAFKPIDFARLVSTSVTSLANYRNAGVLQMTRIGARGWIIPISAAINFIAMREGKK